MFRATRPIRRLAAAVIGGTCVAALLGVSVASAHIDPDPTSVVAGTAVTVGFGVEHGCDGSNTVEVAFKVPEDVTDAQAVDKPGWTTSTADGIVTFSDGDLDADTPETFSLTFTAPTTAGTIHFPIVQTCVVGQLAWIEIAAEGQPEPEHPAPALIVTANSDLTVPATAVGTPATTSATTPTPSTTPATTAATTPETSADTAPAATTAESTSPTTDTGNGANSDTSNNTGLVIGIVVGALVLIGGGIIIASRRGRT